MKYISILSTVTSRKEAEEIATTLVKRGLAACVQIVPGLKSFYRWKGKFCRDAEYLLIIKSKASLFQKIEQAIRKLHSYEVPEIVALPILQGSQSYLKWLDESLLANRQVKKE